MLFKLKKKALLLTVALICCALAIAYSMLALNKIFPSNDYPFTTGGSKNMKDDAEVSNVIKPAEPMIVSAKVTVFKAFEEAKESATFPVKVPTWIPERFELIEIKHVRPDLPGIPENTHNDTVSAFYSDGTKHVLIIQGYFSGGNVPIGPVGSEAGEVEIMGIKANWVKGSWVVVADQPTDKFTNEKQWRDDTLQIGWYNNVLGYAVITDGLKLETLIKIAEGLV